MEQTNSSIDQQPTIQMNNSSSRRKQSKPNRLEHIIGENCSTINVTVDSGMNLSILPSLTPYHVAAEQQDIRTINDEDDDDDDRISLNCEDGSLSSHSTNEQSQTKSPQEQENLSQTNSLITTTTATDILDFTFKIDQNSNEHLFNSTNRSRSLHSSNKSRSLHRKHRNVNLEPTDTTKIFHVEAFCAICRKEFCNKYFLKTHLANKHGIFDNPSVIGTVSTASKEITDQNPDSNNEHPFIAISTLLNNNQEELISSSTDMIQHQNELPSLTIQMNGVIAGNDDDDNPHHEDDDDGDEQDGTGTNPLVNLSEQITTIISNDNNTNNDQPIIRRNSSKTNLDYQSSTITLPRQSSTKILEDFCEICQKHFCNKYYLRKHKFDVHGVQTDCNIKSYKRIDNNSLSSKDSSSSTSIQLSSSFPNLTLKSTTTTTSSSNVQQSLGMLLNPIFSPLIQSSDQQQQQNLLSNNKRRYTDSSNDSSSLSSSKCQYHLSSDVVTNQSIIKNGKTQISPCTLCGKKFQSNDYLQLHLMNKHQIKTDIQQKTNKLTHLMTTSSSSAANQSLNNQNTYKKIKLEPNETTTTSIQTIPATGMPTIVDTYFAAKMTDRVSCEICQKQVCNKYFLKTHKLKVHGIGSDPIATPSNTDEPIDQDDDDEDNNPQPSMDNSPPQLVVDERSTEPGVIPSPDALTASVNTCIQINNHSNDQSVTCDLCSKTFPSKFLLHIHMSNVHGIQQANGTTTTIIVNNTKIPSMNLGMKKSSLTNGTNSVRLKQTPQVQLRVTCQVCKKELCNKYFLRAHMRNVHNISVDDIRLIPSQQQPPSNSTSPHDDKQIFSLSSNLLSTIVTDIDMNSSKHSIISHDNHEINGLHHTDSNQSLNDNHEIKNELLSMQPFLVESDDDLYKHLFVPCMVYLPCRHRVTKPLEISLRLKPVDNTTTTTTNTNTKIE